MGMRLVVDTNAYVDFCKGAESAVLHMRSAEQLYIPLIVIAELRAGFLAGSRKVENEKNLQRFLSSSRTEILFPNEDTTHHYARLFLQLRKQGTPIPINDLWIASLTLQANCYLLSSDKHFDCLEQLMRVS